MQRPWRTGPSSTDSLQINRGGGKGRRIKGALIYGRTPYISLFLFFMVALVLTGYPLPRQVGAQEEEEEVEDVEEEVEDVEEEVEDVAEEGPDRSTDISALLGFTPRPYGGGLAVRVGLPLVMEGFIQGLDDAIYLEVGGGIRLGLNPADYWAESISDWGLGWSVFLPVMVRWTLFLDENWTVFGGVGPSWEITFFDRASPLLAAIPSLSGGFGAFYTLSGRVAVRLDFNSEIIGVGISLAP